MNISINPLHFALVLRYNIRMKLRLIEYRKLCLSENDDVDKLVHSLPLIGPISNHKVLYNGLEDACFFGNGKIVKYLVEHQSLQPTIEHGSILFLEMCQKGDIDTLTWLQTQFPPNTLLVGNSLYIAAKSNQTEVLKWLLGHSSFGPGHIKNAIMAACSAGALEGLQWLAEYFSINLIGCKNIREKGIREACLGGHADVVRWFIDKFHMEDSTTYFERACINAKLEVAKMLLDKFPELLETPHTEIAWYFDYVVSKVNVPMTKWLNEKFPGVILKDDGDLLRDACSRNNLDMALCLIDILHYDPPTVYNILKGNPQSVDLVSRGGECIKVLEQLYGCHFQ